MIHMGTKFSMMMPISFILTLGRRRMCEWIEVAETVNYLLIVSWEV